MEEAKWCFVPTCLNSTRNTVNKWFVPIPVNPKRREEWFKAVNRNYCPNSERSTLFCCSDHFNLKEDAGSLKERDGEVVVKLKKNILPRLSVSTSDTLTPPPLQSRPTRLSSTGTPTPPPLAPTSVKPNAPPTHDFVDLADSASSDEDDKVDIVGVVASNPSEPRQILASQRLATGSVSFPSIGTVRNTSGTVTISPKKNESLQYSSFIQQSHLKTQFQSLREAIPSVRSQEDMPREQILDEAIEFIIQMRHKSDRRQASMHYVMENNAALSAKIQHLENLLALHEKNEIVLTREIIERRLGALAAQRPATLAAKANKQKYKRKLGQ